MISEHTRKTEHTFTHIFRLLSKPGEASITVLPNGSGWTTIPGLGILDFDPPNPESAKSFLGSPFSMDDPFLGYKTLGDERAWPLVKMANAEHEALHLFICSHLFDCISPNHSLLARDIGSQEQILWRTREELLVVGTQYGLNAGKMPELFRAVCQWFELDCEQILPELMTWLFDFRYELAGHFVESEEMPDRCGCRAANGRSC